MDVIVQCMFCFIAGGNAHSVSCWLLDISSDLRVINPICDPPLEKSKLKGVYLWRALLILERSTCAWSSVLFVSVLKTHKQAIDRQLLLFVPSAG